MRRRHTRTVREEERPTLLLMAAGAVVGAAAGLYLGRRYRSMDAFLEDVRDRFGHLRDIWNDEDLLTSRRERAMAESLELDDEYEDDEDEDEDVEGYEADEADEPDEYEDPDDDDLKDSPYQTEEAYHEDVFADDEGELDDIDLLEEDELEEDLAAVARQNGVSSSSLRAEEASRRLEERVLKSLRDEPVLGTRSIEIAVVGDGVVELTGNVQAIDEVARAAAHVRSVPGVNMVLNRLEVRTGGSIDTATVARDPQQAPASEDRT